MAPVQWGILTELTQINSQEPISPECPHDKTPHQVHSALATLAPFNYLRTASDGQPLAQTPQLYSTNVPSAIQTSSPNSYQPAFCNLYPPLINHGPTSSLISSPTSPSPIHNHSHGHRSLVQSISPPHFLKLQTAFESAEALCNSVLRFYGLPEDNVSDRGPQFTSRVWLNFFQQLNINISLTSGYLPDPTDR